MAKLVGGNQEWLRLGWVRSDRMLRRVYNELGPKEVRNKQFKPFPARKFAALSRKQVEENWDFHGKEVMHKVAKVLEST